MPVHDMKNVTYYIRQKWF